MSCAVPTRGRHAWTGPDPLYGLADTYRLALRLFEVVSRCAAASTMAPPVCVGLGSRVDDLELKSSLFLSRRWMVCG